ncbi:MAG TPA: L,D-transpeptidase family protein [Arenicellales bacterium]|nr:L,D-transpeptidase family protein [Arenicellales bacterium]
MPNDTSNTRSRLRAAAVWLAALLLTATAAQANEFVIPGPDASVVGETRIVKAREGDTLLDIARRHKVGYEEIRLANPGVDTWLPGAGTEVVVPTQFVLPDAPREGIVVNVPEMRLYYFPEPRSGDSARVITYPISVGRGDWQTPLGRTEVIRKDRDPAWYPPESIRAEHAARGDYLPKYVPPGPDNPLGAYSLRLGLPGYLIHGTNRPYGIGMKVTHGCLRLYPEDIASLFAAVSPGTPVRIVNQAAKAGWLDGRLYVEIHPEFNGDDERRPANLTPLVDAVLSATGSLPSDDVIDWESVYAIARVSNGIPGTVSTGRTGISAGGSAEIGLAD